MFYSLDSLVILFKIYNNIRTIIVTTICCLFLIFNFFFPLSIGAQFGTVISMPLSGVLSEYGFAGGWPSIFYVFGAIGTLWSIAFLWLVHEDPESHPTIPHDERKYIISSVWGAAGVSVSVYRNLRVVYKYG